MLLSIEDIHVYYGFSYVLQGVSLEIDQGEAVVLLGRNGAGKTTTFKSIMGFLPPKTGKILFDGVNICGMAPFQIAGRGISLVPDTRRIIPNITVYENLKLAMLKNSEKDKKKYLLDMAYGYFPRLKDRAHNLGAALSGGEQQMLAIARSLVSDPKLMLIDEPTEGLMPTLVRMITEKMKELQKTGITMLCIETNLDVAFEIAERVYIMEKGVIKFRGRRDELLGNVEIQQKYLGVHV